MKTIITIFLKELKETLRDRRTLITMIVIPVLIFPLIFKLTSSLSNNFSKKTATKTLVVGYSGEDNRLMNDLQFSEKNAANFLWIQLKDSLEIKELISSDSIDAGVFYHTGFDQALSANETAKITLFHDATDIGYKERLEGAIQQFNAQITQERLDSLNINKAIFSAIQVDESNVASSREMIGKLAGGMLPYIFIIFGFIGCMYPAIDLFTGEKERGTIETLLTTPVPRWQILTGKMGVVVLSGLIAASFALTGLYFSFQNMPGGEEVDELNTVLNLMFTGKTLLLMFLLILPLIVFFAGLLIPITVYAKSFKEAQSIITPLNMAVLIPAMIGMFPGIEYSLQTAFIPVVNVVLATKEIMAGTINYTLYIGTLASLLIYAIIAIILSHRQFGKESNVSTN
jgi:sodium transport system permease protein